VGWSTWIRPPVIPKRQRLSLPQLPVSDCSGIPTPYLRPSQVFLSGQKHSWPPLAALRCFPTDLHAPLRLDCLPYTGILSTPQSPARQAEFRGSMRSPRLSRHAIARSAHSSGLDALACQEQDDATNFLTTAKVPILTPEGPVRGTH